MKLLFRITKLSGALALALMLVMCAKKEEAEQTPAQESTPAQTEAPQEEGGRGNATAAFAGKSVSITYGRPQLGGRDVLALAQDGMVWRLGKDEATEIKSEVALQFGETVVPAGHYSLWLKKVSATEWQLIFNTKTGMWGAPTPTEGDVASASATLTTSESAVETFTIEVTGDGENNGEIKAIWGTSIISAPFTVPAAM